MLTEEPKSPLSPPAPDAEGRAGGGGAQFPATRSNPSTLHSSRALGKGSRGAHGPGPSWPP